jgi:3-hydroxyacyl-CoA dehydrogenase
MFYADTVGLQQICERIDEFSEALDPQYWKVSPLLRRLADSGGSLSDFVNE